MKKLQKLHRDQYDDEVKLMSNFKKGTWVKQRNEAEGLDLS